MKALILNSGMGTRMGDLTKEHPKCMTAIGNDETIISRQLKILSKFGIEDIVITTGYFDDVLQKYCDSLNIAIRITYVKNPIFKETNYIYSIYCAKQYLEDDIFLMHGDLVFTEDVLNKLLLNSSSCMAVSSTIKLPEKDFKAVIHNDKIEKIGIEFFDDALAAQPLYKLNKNDWKVWLDNIVNFCENGNVKCYAENAFNEISNKCIIKPLDIMDELCSEIDNPNDLEIVCNKLNKQ